MKPAVRVFFAYKHIDAPWGGANSFIRTLHNGIKQKKTIKIINNINSKFDILFMNQLSMGPAKNSKKWKLSQIRKHLKTQNHNSLKRQLVVRAINLSTMTSEKSGLLGTILSIINDFQIIKLLQMANLVIFQSEYQQQAFNKNGFNKKNYKVIYNCADPIFWDENPQWIHKSTVLNLAAVCFSNKNLKRFDLISKISLLKNVKISFFGNWPERYNSNNVILKGVKDKQTIINGVKNCHYLFHPAERDVCPNVVLEALALGVPVIYNGNSGGSRELVQTAGLSLQENDLSETINKAQNLLSYHRRQTLLVREKFHYKKCIDKYIKIFETAKK